MLELIKQDLIYDSVLSWIDTNVYLWFIHT